MISDKELELFPLLQSLPTTALSKLTLQTKSHYFSEQQPVIHKGDKVGGAYLVTSGCLRVYTIDITGKESTLYEIKAGESCLLAMNCLFSNLLYPAWVSCSSPMTRVLVIPSAVYKNLHETEKAIQQFTVNTLSHRIFNLMTVMEETLSYSLEQRIISYLIRKADSEHIIRTSHQEIASEMGSAREVVSRILKRMEASEQVILSRGKIKLLALEELRSALTA